MEERDLPAINKILDSEKWVMEKAYTECAFKTDPSGFFVAEKADGEIIGNYIDIVILLLYTMSLSLLLKDYNG